MADHQEARDFEQGFDQLWEIFQLAMDVGDYKVTNMDRQKQIISGAPPLSLSNLKMFFTVSFETGPSGTRINILFADGSSGFGDPKSEVTKLWSLCEQIYLGNLPPINYQERARSHKMKGILCYFGSLAFLLGFILMAIDYFNNFPDSSPVFFIMLVGVGMLFPKFDTCCC